MKIFKKTLTLFVLAIIFVSCTSDKKTLTKDHILDHLKQREIEQPIVFKNSFPVFYIKSKEELNNGVGYYKQLYNEGYIDAILRSDIPNPETSNRPYKVVLTDKSKPYILETDENGVAKVITLEFNAVEVIDIRMISDFKAEVDVVFKKTKTPFNKTNEKDYAGSGKEYSDDTHIKTLDFRKNQNSNEWKSPVKIIF